MGRWISMSFDRVNHDILMARVARTVKDKRVLRLIRHYLQAGVMTNGVVMGAEEGTPQILGFSYHKRKGQVRIRLSNKAKVRSLTSLFA